MRDTHRIKEKYELSLDNRQIVTLTLAALVVLGGVFVLGVVVGKKLAGEPGAQPPPTDLLTAVDQKTTVLENVQKDASLTFQDELTRKAPVEPKPVEPVKVAEVKKPEPVKPEPGDVKAELAQKLAEASRAPDAAQPDAAVAPREVAKLTDAPDAARLPEAVKIEPVTTRTNDAGALKEAFGKVQKTPEPPKPPETSANGAWTLQLAAYQDRAEADRFAAGLRDKGYAPFIIEATIPGKGVWYRVRMGRFATKDAATRYLADFKRETSLPAIVAQ